MKKLFLIFLILTTFLFITSCDKKESENNNDDTSSNINEEKNENVLNVGFYISNDQLFEAGITLEELNEIYFSEKSYKIEQSILFKNSSNKNVLILIDKETQKVENVHVFDAVKRSETASQAEEKIKIGMTLENVVEKIGYPDFLESGIKDQGLMGDEDGYMLAYGSSPGSSFYIILDYENMLVISVGTLYDEIMIME